MQLPRLLYTTSTYGTPKGKPSGQGHLWTAEQIAVKEGRADCPRCRKRRKCRRHPR